MTDIEKGWLAGLIDGEGSIMLFRKKSDNGKNTYVTAQLTITNNHNETLLKASSLIEEITGKCPRYVPHIHGKFQKKPCMRLEIAIYSHIKNILEFLLPCFVTKRERAMVALEFVTKAMVKNKLKGYEREQYWQKMKMLNHYYGRSLSAETKCKPPVLQGEVIVRSSEKSEEIVRNDNPTSKLELVAC